MLGLLAIATAASNVAACSGSTAVEVNACLDARFNDSDAILNHYFQTALARINKESGRGTAQRFVQAEQSWIAYRDAECGSVFDSWKGGTIRVSMEVDCRIRLTQLRTYAIWRDWLTYPDNSRALLPRPEIEPVPGR